MDHGLPIGGEDLTGHGAGGGAGFGGVADEDFGDVHGHGATGAAGDEAGVAFEGIPDTGTDGSEAGQADANGGLRVHGAHRARSRRIVQPGTTANLTIRGRR